MTSVHSVDRTENQPTSKKIVHDKVDVKVSTFEVYGGDPKLNAYLKDIILEKRDKDPKIIDSHETAGHSVKCWVTKWDTLETDDRFQPVADYVLHVLNYIMDNVFHTHADFKIVSLWAVVMEAGEHADPHDHFTSSWSCVYYIDVEEDVAPIFLENKQINIEPGLLVLFPGNVVHHVPTTTGRRIAVAMNIDKVCPPK